jgi:hypothetical protein
MVATAQPVPPEKHGSKTRNSICLNAPGLSQLYSAIQGIDVSGIGGKC